MCCYCLSFSYQFLFLQYSETGAIATLPVVPGKCLPPKLHGKPKSISIHLIWGMYENLTYNTELIEFVFVNFLCL